MNRELFPQCPNCDAGRMSVHADGCAWCDRCESAGPPGPPSALQQPWERAGGKGGPDYPGNALIGQRPSPADELSLLRRQVEQLSAEKITLLAALELAAPYLCGDKCPSVKLEHEAWTHCAECESITRAIQAAKTPT